MGKNTLGLIMLCISQGALLALKFTVFNKLSWWIVLIPVLACALFFMVSLTMTFVILYKKFSRLNKGE